MDPAMIHLVEQEQVEPTAGLLVPLQDRASFLGVTPPAVRLDRDRLDSEESQEGTAGAVLPPPAQAVQDHAPVGIGIEELALDATRVYPPF